MSLAAQWQRMEAGLPPDWTTARLAVRIAGAADVARAAALLGPLTPGLAGNELRIQVARRGAGPSPASVGRAVARLDDEKIAGELRLLGSERAEAGQEPVRRASLPEAWDTALATLPPDWSDIYAEVELTSSDHLGPAALALAPVNPSLLGGPLILRFRCARRFGYGASEGMVRRCLARLDEREIPGTLRILRVLCDTKPVATQGPVWYVGGKAV